ncbi:hypothetical protein CDAR_701 [Caerostris darwini]|uniref:Uncharacterized protein n=1 Tax=Caerostris darwini TaxID=1538125 RepID=A0AAV4UCF9_9ARAC|nr:hypothetical protein CDAR_701 [Caerostris darwini]
MVKGINLTFNHVANTSMAHTTSEQQCYKKTITHTSLMASVNDLFYTISVQSPSTEPFEPSTTNHPIHNFTLRRTQSKHTQNRTSSEVTEGRDSCFFF